MSPVTVILIVIFGLVYTAIWIAVGYSSWRNPEKFIASNVARVKDWWPLARFYRKLFGSVVFLWIARLGSILGILLGVALIFFTLTSPEPFP
jgi:hypothetical protein